MPVYDADLHLHSLYSGGTSPRMTVPEMAKGAKLKGLDILGTGDALHPKWIKHVRRSTVEDEYGLLKEKRTGVLFVPTVEVEDENRVHHLVILPDLETAEDLREELARFSPDIDEEGRPHVRMSAEELAEVLSERECLFGPAHAFVPWTSVFKEYDSLRDCYGRYVRNVDFVELGLSADSDYADMISELHDYTFLTCSDAHSPYPHRLGREFVRFELEEPSYDALAAAIRREGGRNRVVLNVGLFPELGKYNRTACARCKTRFDIDEARALRWRCPECGGRIKKGVYDRVRELADLEEPEHPEHRPPYLHVIPLAEMIAKAVGVSSPTAKTVQVVWRRLVDEFGSEINVLIEVPVERIAKVDERVAGVVEAFREGTVRVVPGGGGEYGRILLEGEEGPEPPERGRRERRQLTLDDFTGGR
ncbi:MAG: TIGR00375 family protein [Methanopyri archaeon]|nr:TIGR00375 family protein [Methanopyri archaeon]